MHLIPRETDKLLLRQTGLLAQTRLARGLRLNLSEATALIATVLQELARDGSHSVADLMSIGKTILGTRHVLPAVPHGLQDVQIEGTFTDGTFLVTVHHPVCSDALVDLTLALHGSGLSPPQDEVFKPAADDVVYRIPGEVQVAGGDDATPIQLNADRKRVILQVTNTGDRPIQVGSHYHFSETNRFLSFDRDLALFKRLDIAAGTAVRFEPGESKTVTLVDIGGARKIRGGNGLFSHLTYDASSDARASALAKAIEMGFKHSEMPRNTMEALGRPKPASITREAYASMFGPTTGDRIRLGDTELWIEVEKDCTHYGDECKFGGGKVLRDGMGQATARSDADTLDLVLTNALIVDWSGIYKADIGIKRGFIAGIGKAGNPDVMDHVDEHMVVGSNTEVIAAEKLIVTAGAIDAHVHFMGRRSGFWHYDLDWWRVPFPFFLVSGTVRVSRASRTGPSAGTNATTCTPSKTYIQTMLQATDGIPLNFGFTGKGNDSETKGLAEQIEAGALGLKLHEDWGSTPAAIDSCLTVCDKYDVQCNIHTDTLNESGYVEDTIAAFKGRTIHTYHSEGAGGGHAPDIIVVCGQENVLPSSTNPTRPYCANTLDEHLDMLMVCHHLDKSIPEDIAFAESRIRAETVAAEDVLHDSGAISIISSDSQAMGRIGEVVARTWRTAAKMRSIRGPLKGVADEISGNDNERVKRYVAKYTINPALAHGISHVVGDIAKGKLADLVLWNPSHFGAKPEQIIKGGVIAWAQMGDANASIPTVQPVMSRPMWGARPEVAALNSIAFVSQVSITDGHLADYGLKKRAVGVKGCRTVRKTDMKNNSALPTLSVDPETYRVVADGEHATIEAATTLPLTQNYFVF